jgi:hypothetical protein
MQIASGLSRAIDDERHHQRAATHAGEPDDEVD